MRQWQRRKTRDQSKEGKKAFQNLQRQLRLIQDENDVDCLYLGIVDAPTLSMIYLVDGAHEDACSPGCFDEYSRTIKQLCDIFYVPIEKMVDDVYDIPEYYEIDRYQDGQGAGIGDDGGTELITTFFVGRWEQAVSVLFPTAAKPRR